MQVFTVYTDGSYLEGTKETHGGVVYMGEDGQYASKIHVYTKLPKIYAHWNVGGELIAAYAAIQSIASRVLKQNEECMDTYQLNIIYDYQGIGLWTNGIWKLDRTRKVWKANKPGSIWFVKEMKRIKEQVPNLEVNFIWVKGHSKTEGNKEADRVASYDMRYCKANDIPICLLDEIIQI